MKTRSNMPLFVLEVSDVKALSNSQIDLLRCGDWLVKKDASGEHPYQVTFKKEGVGMCLTYHDASVIETQSYDWNNSLKKWVYNSEDKTPNLLDAQTEDDVEDIVEDLVEGGTLDNAKPIYCHPVSFTNETAKFRMTALIFNNDPTPFTITSFKEWIDNLYQQIQDNIRIMITGGYKHGSLIMITSWLFYNGTNYGIAGLSTTGEVDVYSSSYNSLFPEGTTFTDGVNKIN